LDTGEGLKAFSTQARPALEAGWVSVCVKKASNKDSKPRCGAALRPIANSLTIPSRPKRAATAVKYVAASVAIEKRKDICEQNEERTENHYNSQRTDLPWKSHCPYEAVEHTFPGKLACPEKQEYRNDAEYSQQRQDGAENDRASPHDFFSHRVTLVAPGCDFSRQPFRERRSSFDRRKMLLIFVMP
jgi:hypothetical protein